MVAYIEQLILIIFSITLNICSSEFINGKTSGFLVSGLLRHNCSCILTKAPYQYNIFNAHVCLTYNLIHSLIPN